MRRAARRDANESPLVQLFRDCGFYVCRLHTPVDLLIGCRASRRWGLVEIKDGSKVASKKRLTPAQEAFWAETAGLPRWRIENEIDALNVVEELRTWG